MATKPAAKKKKTPKNQNLSDRYRFSKTILVVFVGVFAVVGAYFLLKSFAAPAAPNVYLTPSATVFGANTTFTVQVRETSGTTGVNAVQANVSYNPALVSFVGVTDPPSNPAFGIDAQCTPTSCTPSGSVVAIGRGVNGGNAPVTGDQLITTLTFKSLTSTGTSAFALTTGTLLLNATTNADILGSLSNTTGTSVLVDTTPPTITPNTPADGAVLAGGTTIPITVNASDNDQVASVAILIDGTTVATLTTSPYTYNWNTAGVALGTHAINATATDRSGNLQGFKAINVTLADKTAPSAPTSFRTTGSTISSIALAWNASTDNVGVTTYKISRGGTLIATINSPTLVYNDATGLSANTPYSYSITAQDAAGNTSSATALIASTAAVTPGDVNSDGHVNILDLGVLLNAYNSTGSNLPSDINKDNVVNIIDLSILLTHYGS